MALPAEFPQLCASHAISRGNYERATNPDIFYPEFECSRDRFNQIRQAVIENREVGLTVFENDSTATENYVVAVLDSQMEVDCPVRAQARRYLKRLDPTSYDHFYYREENH